MNIQMIVEITFPKSEIKAHATPFPTYPPYAVKLLSANRSAGSSVEST